MKNFTNEQKKCLDYNKHQAVTANAGSGKTRILVERYLSIIYDKVLENESSIDDIVAITFTKKAAAEMQTRVIKELNNVIKEENDDDRRQKLEHVRNNMIYSRISTIHSFCGQLLKEYPIEAGVAYNYQELDDYDRDILIEQATDEIFEKILDDNYDLLSKEEFSFDIIAIFEYNAVREFIFSLLRSNENARLIYDFFEKDELEIQNFYFDELQSLMIEPLKALSDDYLVFFENTNVNKMKQEHQSIFYDLLSFVKSNIGKIDDITDYKELLIIFIQLTIHLTNKKGNSFIKTLVNKDIPTFNENYDKIDKLFANTQINYDTLKIYQGLQLPNDLIQNLIDELIDDSIHYIRNVKKLVLLTKQINDRFNELKLSLPALTFDDILLKSLELLQNNNNDVRNKISSKIKYLLVDEFQDTNQLQYEIIKYIVDDIETNQISDKTNLFIVGDDKQSIYGFRSADVRVFKRTKQNIEDHNNNSNDNGLIVLKESFRMLPAITGFINFVFEESMKSEISEFDVDYNEFINGRVNSENGELTNIGSVRFLMSFKPFVGEVGIDESEDNEIEENLMESEKIAQYIKVIIKNENGEFNIEKDGESKSPSYSDIAIISRKRKIFGDIGASLLQNYIPYEISKGAGFFQSMEIIELTSALKFFADNNDDISCAALLKSNMFNLDDKHLIEISAADNTGSFWHKFQKYYLLNKDNFIIERTYNILSEFIELADKLPMESLLNLLIEKTSLIAAVSGTHKSEQMKANIFRFVDYVHNFESKGFKNISDLIRQINTLMEQSSEPEAAVFSGTDSVKILTVHASKGLEFPIVILADANYYDSNRKNLLDKDFGVNIKFAKPDAGIGENVLTTVVHNLISSRQELADEAENKRLLYVALSRAKDHLIISGKLKETKDKFYKPVNFLKTLLEPFYNFKGEEFYLPFKSMIQGEPYSEIINIPDFPIYYNDEQTTIPLKFEIPFIYKFDFAQDEIKEVEEEEKIIDDTQILGGDTIEQISATKLTSFFADELDYDFKYFLGLTSKFDTNLDGLFADPDKENEQIVGSRAGTYLHNIMQYINYWLPKKNQIDLLKLNELIDKLEIQNSSKIIDALRERIITESTNIAKTKFIQNNYQILKNSKFEITYSMPIESNILVATIDLLLIENGKAIICDWKSNRASKPSDIAHHYELQMKTYSYILSFLYPEQDEFVCKLLLSRLAKEDCEDSQWIHEFKFFREELKNFEIYLKENINFIKFPIDKIKNFNKNFINKQDL